MKLQVITAFAPEIEGGWNLEAMAPQEVDGRTVYEEWRIKTDGSVSTSHGKPREAVPLSPFRTLEHFEEAWEEIKPYFLEVNSSCGLHIHCSFKTPDGYRVWSDPKMFELLHEHDKEITGDAYPQLVERLINHPTTYAKPLNEAEKRHLKEIVERGIPVDIDRYREVNWDAFRKYGSIEFRYLPGVPAGLVYPVVSKFIKVVDALTLKNLQQNGVDISPIKLTIKDIEELEEVKLCVE